MQVSREPLTLALEVFIAGGYMDAQGEFHPVLTMEEAREVAGRPTAREVYETAKELRRLLL